LLACLRIEGRYHCFVLRKSSANPAAVFESHGLRSRGFWGFTSLEESENEPVDIGQGLCAALQSLGGIYAVFGRFLCWRSDLLDSSSLLSLRHIKPEFPVIPVSAVAAAIRRELGPNCEELAASLEGPPLWNTLSRTAYRSRYGDRSVIVQVARDPVTPQQFAEFEEGVSALRGQEAEAIVSPAVLAQFEEWVRSGESLARERSFLDVLRQHVGETLVDYPVPIPGLSSTSFMCWYAAEGWSASELIALGDGKVMTLIASAILEQFFSMSMVDADLDPETMIVDQNNRLHFNRLHNPIAVPPSLVNNGIKYTSAVLAGDAFRSAQTLIRLMHSQPPLDLEQRLIDEFSGIEPELKINMWFPASAGAFESNWRALAKLAATRPLFLDCLHRNLVAVGYWNSDVVKAGAVQTDAISESQWPVVGRLLRTQFGMLANKQSAMDWAASSGLVMFGALREMNRLVEEMRDNDLTIGVDISEPIISAPTASDEKRPDRFSSGVALGSLLVVLLLSLLLGGVVPAPWPVLLKVLAVSTLPAMFWVVSKMR
jgi:hypothetical protein